MKSKILLFLIGSSVIYSCNQSDPITVKPTPTVTPTANITPSVTPTISVTPATTASPIPQVTASASVVVVSTPTPVFTALPKTNTILFDTSIRPFKENSTDSISNLSKLNALLVKEKYTVLFGNLNNQDLSKIDTVIVVSPSVDYSEQDIEKLKNFVLGGKKVFISGEWGGYGGVTVTAINKFLSPANLKINEDVIKESNTQNYDFNDEQILIKDFVSHPLTANVSKLSFYSTASVDILNTQNTKAKIIAQSSDTSFRVKANTYKSGVIGVAEYGNGKIIVTGDSSFLLDNDSNSNSISNIEEDNNKNFVLNMLKW